MEKKRKDRKKRETKKKRRKETKWYLDCKENLKKKHKTINLEVVRF